MSTKKVKKVEDIQAPTVQVITSPYPQTEEALKADAWQLTHTAVNGNLIYTKHLLVEGFKYAEVQDGKVIDVRSIQ